MKLWMNEMWLCIWRRLFGCFALSCVRRVECVVYSGGGCDDQNQERVRYVTYRIRVDIVYVLFPRPFTSVSLHQPRKDEQWTNSNRMTKNEWFTHIPLEADNNADDEETEAFQLTWWAWVHYMNPFIFDRNSNYIGYYLIWKPKSLTLIPFRHLYFFIGDKIWCCMRLSLSYVGRETPVVDRVNDLVILGI